MQQFIAWLSGVLNSWKFWIVIAPWEVGVRIRLGRKAVALGPGLHLRIPWVASGHENVTDGKESGRY